MDKLAVGYFIFVIIAMVGYVENIVKLLHMSFDPLTAMAVLRSIGICIPPLGTILGFM